MATVTKDFKVKNGLIVEGTTATVNNFDVLTKKTDDQNYIVNLIGGTATSANVADKVVKRDGSGNFAAGTVTANLVGDVTGNADTATALETARTISLTGDATGSASFDGTANAQITVTLNSSFATDAEVATAKGEAIDAAELYTDNAITALNLAGTYDAIGAAAAALTDANEYTDDAVAALVNGAPALLDTLNELASAINSDAGFATTIGTQIGEKVAKAGDTMTGALTLSGAPTQNLHAATKAYVDSAQTAAEGYASGLDSATNTRIDNLSTSNVAEGSNEYFTSSRAKTAAAELLTGATLSNITITGTGAGLTITAEDGIAGKTTDDLTEGTSNLYFTDVRAVDALEAVVPNFTAVELNSVAKQVAATANIGTASTNNAVSWLKAEYRSAEFLVKIANGSHTDVSKVILTLDTSDNVAITEYAMVGTNGSLGSVSADVSGNDVRLRVTTANNNSDVTVVGTLLA